VADAEDCVDAARHLAQQGVVDPARMAIRGSSSGGLTALNALAAGDCFAAAVTWYGVTDLLGLAASTHDFEAHYMDRLIGPLPESREIYEARSPTRRAAEIHGSVLRHRPPAFTRLCSLTDVAPKCVISRVRATDFAGLTRWWPPSRRNWPSIGVSCVSEEVFEYCG
jgi:acetyl esterase/lipase